RVVRVGLLHRPADDAELIGVHHYYARHAAHHGIVKQSRIPGNFHRHFVRRPQLLHELRQTLQSPLRDIGPFVFQSNAAGEPIAMQIDSDISLFHLSLLVVYTSRSSSLTLRRSPHSYARSPYAS